MNLRVRPNAGRVQHRLTPATMQTAGAKGWKHLSFEVLVLQAGETHTLETASNEMLITVLSGNTELVAGNQTFKVLGRRSVFDGAPHALYLPPQHSVTIHATSALEIAVGAAPASGACPVRFLTPNDCTLEVRGEANVQRFVTHLIAPPICEKLFVFEVFTPSGNWSGFPPHRHDGRGGSSYLEETYYFRVQPNDGFGSMRVYTGDTDLDEFMLVKDQDLVLVPEGYHPTNAAPGSNMYFLNYLAGPTPDYTVVNDPAHDWVKNDWAGKPYTPK